MLLRAGRDMLLSSVLTPCDERRWICGGTVSCGFSEISKFTNQARDWAVANRCDMHREKAGNLSRGKPSARWVAGRTIHSPPNPIGQMIMRQRESDLPGLHACNADSRRPLVPCWPLILEYNHSRRPV